MKRNPSVELYRILLMFGIVLLHCAGKGSVQAPWPGNLLKFCVVGFVFISGYFGIRFSWKKLFALYGIAFYCACLGAGVEWWQASSMSFFENVFRNMQWFWFLHAYAILMMFAPVLNCVFERKRETWGAAIFPVLLLVWGWSYCYEIGHLRPYVFSTIGLGSHTPLTLIGIYLAAQWFRESKLEERISTRMAIVVCLLMLPVAVVGLAPYNSIFAFLLALALFVLFERLPRCGAWTLAVAPSMFSVYLLHSTRSGLDLIAQCVSGDGVLRIVSMLLTAITLFLICIVCDVPRRIFMISIKKVAK